MITRREIGGQEDKRFDPLQNFRDRKEQAKGTEPNKLGSKWGLTEPSVKGGGKRGAQKWENSTQELAGFLPQRLNQKMDKDISNS